MPPLDRRDDFQDDGGTPMWRRNQARQRAVYEATRPGFVGWWRRSSPGKIFVVVFAVGLFVPAAIFVFGLLGAYLLIN